MNARPISLLAVALALGGCGGGSTSSIPAPVTSPVPSQQTQSAAIGRLADTYVAAWNAHDAHAFAQTYTTDGDLTNIFGIHVQGRSAIETLVGAAFGKFFGASVQTLDDRSIRFLSTDTASVDLHWSMTGATVPGWPATQHGLQSWIVTQQSDGTWLIAVLHNMTLPPAGP